ncbi:MAG: hypothetical protein KBD78_03975 [Oligoflexales bacterium]|nr:hypothetical protein [Oligoflexales bacterium]
MKNGLKTTEFWVTILTTIGAASASLSGVLDPKYAAIVAGIGSLAYSISRTIAKFSGHLEIDPKMSPK